MYRCGLAEEFNCGDCAICFQSKVFFGACFAFCN